MKIGTFLNLEIKRVGEKIQKYQCKVIEKDDQYLYVDYPIHEKTRKTSFFSIGTTCSASYLGSDMGVYSFHTKIISKATLTVPALVIEYPEQSRIQRIQRREFVRVETIVDIAVHSLDNKFSPFTSVTSDISGGGLSFTIPKHITLNTDQHMDVCIILISQTGDYKYIFAKAEIVLIKPVNESLSKASLKFISITKQAQQGLIRYCFEKQRELRKKELQY
ncbi:c-di-GMP-binding flagellar brake protein YcgR [Virgibacillus natechei]|uniref:C-di-GMP-binding flagellar brake protein YcgR n=1 Tax=Virgibacillus natechei TaxID=1216297 RepID=A0ABS4IFB1_9BACI|nr:flagellar brake domain-containing protein [Virgibacillus natechei]MBP1969628.1 c-di-GMP-binding flagellar brake protein YcgR [Virgibacillus natechei]UZD11356.1 flagellar brake domain-containing protein [Virgibacillus natechei]